MKRNIAIKWFKSIDSTNNEAIRNIDDYDSMTVIAAESQTAGKGQRGNGWYSEAGMNLTFSIIVKFEDFPASEQFTVSQAVSLGICDYLRRFGLEAKIKWPNDIYVGDRKICGILIENGVRSGSLARSIIGIGLNLNQTEWGTAAPNPTSLAAECPDGGPYFPEKELETLVCDIFSRLDSKDNAEIRAGYKRKMYRIDEFHEYENKKDGGKFYGKIIGTTEKGTLLVQDREGAVKEFAFKEIGYII